MNFRVQEAKVTNYEVKILPNYIIQDPFLLILIEENQLINDGSFLQSSLELPVHIRMNSSKNLKMESPKN